MSRREEVLDAAVAVLGTGGARTLTHRAVDAEGALPAGTTSNYFRSRTALIDGVLGHLAAEELELSHHLLDAAADITSIDGLVEASAQIVDQLLGDNRHKTMARYAIMLEAMHRPELQPALVAWTEPWWKLAATLLTHAGATAPRERARLLLSCIDGIMFDQLARPRADFDAHAALRPVIAGLVD